MEELQSKQSFDSFPPIYKNNLDLRGEVLSYFQSGSEKTLKGIKVFYFFTFIFWEIIFSSLKESSDIAHKSLHTV